MNVLITGITGFVGSALAEKCIAQGDNVVGIVRDLRKGKTMWGSPRASGIPGAIAFGDVCDLNLVQRVIADYEIEVVFHLAASSIVAYAQRAPVQAILNNVESTLSILESCRVCGKVKSIVIQASDKVYGNQDPPLTEDMALLADEPYSVSKAMSDMAAATYFSTYGLPIATVRPCNIYGPGDLQNRVIPNTIRRCLRGEDPIIFDKDDKREFIYIDDVCDALITVANAIDRTMGEQWNVGSGQVRNNGEVVDEILKHFPDLRPEHVVPKDIKEIPQQWLDSSKIANALNWMAETRFSDGIQMTVESWRRNDILRSDHTC